MHGADQNAISNAVTHCHFADMKKVRAFRQIFYKAGGSQ